MTPDEYVTRLKSIEDRKVELLQAMDEESIQLAREYAFGGNTVKAGDILESVNGDIIMVDRVKFTRSTINNNGLPCCVYEGNQLTKKLQPRANPIRLKLFQPNVAKVVQND